MGDPVVPPTPDPAPAPPSKGSGAAPPAPAPDPQPPAPVDPLLAFGERFGEMNARLQHVEAGNKRSEERWEKTSGLLGRVEALLNLPDDPASSILPTPKPENGLAPPVPAPSPSVPPGNSLAPTPTPSPAPNVQGGNAPANPVPPGDPPTDPKKGSGSGLILGRLGAALKSMT